MPLGNVRTADVSLRHYHHQNPYTMNLRKIKQLETELKALQTVPQHFGNLLNKELSDAIEDMIISKQYELRMQRMQD